MTNNERREFIEKLCDNLKISMINNIELMPPEWDELELRSYMTFKARQFNPIKMTRTRMYNFKECIEKNKL